jgi:predicted small metal-binding protein
MRCSVKISADTDDELLEVAVQHACRTHAHQDTPELRSQLRQMFKTDMTSERKAA